MMGKETGEPGDKPAPRGPTRDKSTKKGFGFKPSRAWNGRQTFKKPTTHHTKFKGKCAELKGLSKTSPTT
jgi:hypothetical protein